MTVELHLKQQSSWISRGIAFGAFALVLGSPLVLGFIPVGQSRTGLLIPSSGKLKQDSWRHLTYFIGERKKHNINKKIMASRENSVNNFLSESAKEYNKSNASLVENRNASLIILPDSLCLNNQYPNSTLDYNTTQDENVQKHLQAALISSSRSIKNPVELIEECLKNKRTFGNISLREQPPIAELRCKVVAVGDRKLPDRLSPFLPKSVRDGKVLKYLDAIYHAIANDESSHLRYYDIICSSKDQYGRNLNHLLKRAEYNESQLVAVLKQALGDAGYVLLGQRDLDLCEALNTGYLLRLSIVPDVHGLDSELGKIFFGSHSESVQQIGVEALQGFDKDENDMAYDSNVLPFDGKVLIFRRGYSSEVTEGRLLIPKIDYLQAVLVQRSMTFVVEGIAKIERECSLSISKTIVSARRSVQAVIVNFLFQLPKRSLLRKYYSHKKRILSERARSKCKLEMIQRQNTFKLARYRANAPPFIGTSSLSDLTSFLACPIQGDDGLEVSCEYDLSRGLNHSSTRLLERVSIGDIVDFSSQVGKRRLLRSFLSKSQLVEPTFEEVVVIWRPTLSKRADQKIKKSYQFPRLLYDMAEIFAVEDQLPKKPESEPQTDTMPLEIRVFKNVQMSNLPAVMPKTRLVFRPADAFLFDAISVFTLLAVLASQKFDNPKFDLIAIVSVILWLLRTFFRYSNKLARYELVVKKFLTSKLAQRGAGALKYVINEGGYQRAVQAALLYEWIKDNRISSKKSVVMNSSRGIQDSLSLNYSVDIDVSRAYNDLVDLGLLRNENESDKFYVEDDVGAIYTLRKKWVSIFDNL